MKSEPRRHLRRRTLLGSLIALGSGAPWHAHAQDTFPNKPMRLVVPFTPGGVTDSSGRVVADFLGKRLGQQVVVDNKPGASGNIGTAQVANAAADGYTLLLAFDGTMVINPHVFAKVPFDTMKDFAPVGKIGDATLILVAHPDLPAKTLQELIALSKTQRRRPRPTAPRASAARRTSPARCWRSAPAPSSTHVPYKGGGQAMTDVLGGNDPAGVHRGGRRPAAT